MPACARPTPRFTVSLALALAGACGSSDDTPSSTPSRSQGDASADAPDALAAGASDEITFPVSPPSPSSPSDPPAGSRARARIDHATGALTVTAPWRPDTLLQSPPGRALVAVMLAPEAPDAWHDPETTKDADFIDVRDLQPVSPTDGLPRGGVRLRGAIPGGGTIDLTFSPTPDGEPAALVIDAVATGAPVALIALRLAADPAGSAYIGFGERFGHVDARAEVVSLAMRAGSIASGTNEAHVPIPTWTSTRGYGVTVASYEAGAVDVAAMDPRVVRAVLEGGTLRARIVAHPRPLEVVAALSRTNGLPRLPPRWSFAPIQWTNHIDHIDEVFYELDMTRAKKVPGGGVWIDNPWQTSYNDFTFIPSHFPDPAGMVKKINALGFELMLWSTPYLEIPRGEPKTEAQRRYEEARAKKYFVVDTSGKPFSTPAGPKKRLALIDFINDAARAWWSEKASAVASLGVVGFKLDYGEELAPELFGSRLPLLLDGKPMRASRGRFAIAYHRAYRGAFAKDDALRARSFLLGRASALGGAGEVDAIWPGDLDRDFRPHTGRDVGGLAASVVAIQTLAASGYPTYAADTGGYRGGTPTKEQVLRWAEHTAYGVVMQNGGAGKSHNPWHYDEEAVDAYRKLARRHMDLVPYLRALSTQASIDGTPTVRALPLAYPDEVDKIARHADDEYLLGPEILVAPAIGENMKEREVYVPTGAWVRWSNGERVVGPKLVKIPTPYGDPPVLVREGAVLPLLAADVDTLLDATEPAGVVTAAMRASVYRAHAVPAKKGVAKWEDGATLEVEGRADAVAVAFAPKATSGTLTITLDLAGRALPSAWTFGGSALTRAASADEALTCAGGCYWEEKSASRVTVRIVGKREVIGK